MASKVDDDDLIQREAKGRKAGEEDDGEGRSIGAKGGIDSKASTSSSCGADDIIGTVNYKAEAKETGNGRQLSIAVEEEDQEGVSLVHRVAKFFFEDDTFANSFETWVEDHAHLIDLGTDECKLE